MPWSPGELDYRAREVARAILDRWAEQSPTPSQVVRESLAQIENAPQDSLRGPLEEFVDNALEAIETDQPWSEAPLGILLRGLYSIARQYLRAPDIQKVLMLCNDVRAAVERVGRLETHRNELMAALMVVEDAASAIAGYAELRPFQHVDEAYLAKYGLLQALQVGFDGSESVARCLGSRIRADRVAGGKAVLVARNIVAGHPVGGTMSGESWHHFHDRSSAHESGVINVMSFSRTEPERWTGQILLTDELVTDGISVISEVLRRALTEYQG